jgi:hypothetical protein
MDLNEIILQLIEERDEVAHAIRSLEGLLGAQAGRRIALVEGRSSLSGRTRANGGTTQNQSKPKSNRGRKFMDAQARIEVSERMKRYWATRRQMDSASLGSEMNNRAFSAVA